MQAAVPADKANDPYDLDRFVAAQANVYDRALA
jgi:uncharacterized protein (DUF1810 family)